MVGGVVCAHRGSHQHQEAEERGILWSKGNDETARRLEEGMAVAGWFIRS
jgi:hypothetical protein